MNIYVEITVILFFLVLCQQFYSFSISRKGLEKQRSCQNLGIAFMTVGITALVFRSVPFAVAGLILMMLGFRLLAKGLDRLDKSIFIDRYKDDDQ